MGRQLKFCATRYSGGAEGYSESVRILFFGGQFLSGVFENILRENAEFHLMRKLQKRENELAKFRGDFCSPAKFPRPKISQPAGIAGFRVLGRKIGGGKQGRVWQLWGEEGVGQGPASGAMRLIFICVRQQVQV